MTVKGLRRAARKTADGRFPAPYHMSVSLDEAELLYALVRATRPLTVLELGTGLGVTALFIDEALRENGDDGVLTTVEPMDEYRARATENLAGTNIDIRARWDGLKKSTWDLVFIDSGYALRKADMCEWLLHPDHKGLVVVHDAERGYPELMLGVGVVLPSESGMWIGRARTC